MKESHKVLLKLLRIALGNEGLSPNPSPDPSTGSGTGEGSFALPSAVDWPEVIDLSFEQGVAAMAVDGLQRIYDEIADQVRDDVVRDDVVRDDEERHAELDSASPALEHLDSPALEDLKYEWFGEVMNSEQDYAAYSETLEEFALLCNGQEIVPMVLKGYGLSLNWPTASHRPCGDIDVYLGECCEFVNQMMENRFSVAVDRTSPHHSTFHFREQLFENHATILSVNACKANSGLEKTLKQLAEEGLEYKVGRAKVKLPTSRFNSLHVLRHLGGDWATDGASLRQVIDWATFVSASADGRNGLEPIDWGFVQKVSREVKMIGFLDVLNGICVEYLGYPREMFPVTDVDAALRDRVMDDILVPECRNRIPERSHRLAYMWGKFYRHIRSQWKRRMVFDETLVGGLVERVKYMKKRDNKINRI